MTKRRIILMCFGVVSILCFLFVVLANLVVFGFRDHIVPLDQIDRVPVVIVLGAKVRADGTPSDILRDRLLTAIDIYNAKLVDKILVSGDDGQTEYDEVNAMRKYLLSAGVDAKDIFLDHAGFDTYDSMARAAQVFGVTNAIIVTQAYHLPRALYLAHASGINAVGISADRQTYLGITRYKARELLADTKAVVDVIFHVAPHFLGTSIDITGDGHVTWDE